MIKKYFRHFIMSAIVAVGLVLVGCGASNGEVADTGVVVVSDVAADEGNEELIEFAKAAEEKIKEDSNVVVSEITVKDVVVDETTSVASDKKVVDNAGKDASKEDKKSVSSVPTNVPASGVTNGTGKTYVYNGVEYKDAGKAEEALLAEMGETSVTVVDKTTNKTTADSNKTGGKTTAVSKPSSVPTNVPASTPAPSSSSSSKNKIKYTDRNGNVTYWDSEAEANAYADKLYDDYVAGFSTSVTLNNGVTDEVNKKREEKGIGALTSTDATDAEALKRAEEIAKDFSHSGATGGENIQVNYGGASNEQVAENYEESWGHKANQNDATYTEGSSATATVTDGDGNVVAQYDVTVFGGETDDATQDFSDGNVPDEWWKD